MKKTCLIITALFQLTTLMAQSIPYGYNDETGAYFDVGNNTKLYYEVYGQGEPLLMLHGGVYGYIDEFTPLISKLAEKYQVICLGTRGHVRSDIGQEPFSFNQRASDAYKLIQYLNLDSVTVIGFSDGSSAAFKLAANYPRVVTAMVVMGTGDKVERDKFTYTAEALMRDSPDYFKKRIENMPEPDRWDESLKMISEMYHIDQIGKETFEKISCPVLLMNGDRDEYRDIESAVRAHNYLVDSRLSIIPGCGHVIFYCNFPAVWESMKGFLGFE
jgi:pimeloyl-ACP methyl ester carboxylesterase